MSYLSLVRSIGFGFYHKNLINFPEKIILALIINLLDHYAKGTKVHKCFFLFKPNVKKSISHY